MHTRQAEDYNAVVNVVNWSLLVVTLLTVLTRTILRWAVARKNELDDTVIMVASIFGAGQTIAISMEVSTGLGRHVYHLTATDKIRFQKSYYAAGLVYIPCICLSKLAVLLLLRKITPIVSHRRQILATEYLTVGWALIAESVLIFQCKMPYPWAILQDHCIDSSAFWYFVGIAQLLLDIALVLLPWIIVRRVQMDMHRKIVIACCFGSRLTVVVAVIAQLVYFHSATKSDDQTFNLWPVTICTQLVQSLSIISACVPYLKPFFDSLETGVTRNSRRSGHRQDHISRRPSTRRPPTASSAHLSGRSVASSTVPMEMESRLPEMPVRSVLRRVETISTISSSRRASPRLPEGVAAQLPQRELSSTRKPATSAGHDCDSDSQTSRTQILKRIDRPDRAKVPRGQPSP
ncbi:MAG: hypothetical protein Q9222_006222 [Ikaeria aurantiellina]